MHRIKNIFLLRSQQGISHIIVPLAIIVIAAIAGTAALVASHADAPQKGHAVSGTTSSQSPYDAQILQMKLDATPKVTIKAPTSVKGTPMNCPPVPAGAAQAPECSTYSLCAIVKATYTATIKAKKTNPYYPTNVKLFEESATASSGGPGIQTVFGSFKAQGVHKYVLQTPQKICVKNSGQRANLARDALNAHLVYINYDTVANAPNGAYTHASATTLVPNKYVRIK